MMEEWRDIEGYEGKYQVSNTGKVKSLARHTHKYRLDKDLILSPYSGGVGYPAVNLRRNGKSRTAHIHVLVAKAFIENPLKKRTVNHIDGIKTNNNVDNLEWATDSENNQHAFDKKLRRPRKSTFGIIAIQDTAILEFDSTNDCAKYFGVVNRTVRAAYQIPCRCRGHNIYKSI